MVTRQSELQKVLTTLADELPGPLWVALVDDNGLIMASVPPDPLITTDRISAMTAASVMMGERVLDEIEAGDLRYASIAGEDRQLLTVVLGEGNYLSIGLGPEVPPRATFGALSRRVPEIIRTITMRIKPEG